MSFTPKPKTIQPDNLKPLLIELTTEQKILKEVRQELMNLQDYEFEGILHFEINDVDRALIILERKYD